VAVQPYNHENIRSISEVKKSLLDQVAEFFVSYYKSPGKKFKVTGVHGPSQAIKRLQQAIEATRASRVKIETQILPSHRL
jgi:inorganic pyrophosphatase